jgi:hypothetical protein
MAFLDDKSFGFGSFDHILSFPNLATVWNRLTGVYFNEQHMNNVGGNKDPFRGEYMCDTEENPSLKHNLLFPTKCVVVNGTSHWEAFVEIEGTFLINTHQQRARDRLI